MLSSPKTTAFEKRSAQTGRRLLRRAVGLRDTHGVKAQSHSGLAISISAGNYDREGAPVTVDYIIPDSTGLQIESPREATVCFDHVLTSPPTFSKPEPLLTAPTAYQLSAVARTDGLALRPRTSHSVLK